jgi:hypothetical protein
MYDGDVKRIKSYFNAKCIALQHGITNFISCPYDVSPGEKFTVEVEPSMDNNCPTNLDFEGVEIHASGIDFYSALEDFESKVRSSREKIVPDEDFDEFRNIYLKFMFRDGIGNSNNHGTWWVNTSHRGTFTIPYSYNVSFLTCIENNTNINITHQNIPLGCDVVYGYGENPYKSLLNLIKFLDSDLYKSFSIIGQL